MRKLEGIAFSRKSKRSFVRPYMTTEDREVGIQSQRVEPALPVEGYPLNILRRPLHGWSSKCSSQTGEETPPSDDAQMYQRIEMNLLEEIHLNASKKNITKYKAPNAQLSYCNRSLTGRVCHRPLGLNTASPGRLRLHFPCQC